MPAVLTHKAIMLLARRRLQDIRDQLQIAVAAGDTVTDLEHRILYLATKCHEMMTDNTAVEPGISFPTGGGYTDPLGRGVSKFAVMGAMGPDLTGFSALLAPGNSWVFDLVHKGNPDQNREPVVARTTDFVLEFWRQVSSALDARSGTDVVAARAQEKARKAMRAYLMGHLCHLAGDIVCHPFIHDLEWHVGTVSRRKFTHAAGEGSIDAKVARQVFLRRSTREGQEWSAWWPTLDEVPPEFFVAYEGTLERIYNARSSRPTGFGAFEKEFTDLQPPVLSVDFIKDGYSVYRNGILGIGYGWGYWSWWAFLIPAVLPLMALFPLALAMPKGRDFLSQTPADVDERAYSEVLSLPLAVSAVIPFFYGSWIAALTNRGVETLTILGITLSGLSVVVGLVFFATLGVSDLPWWFRWLILFGVPLASGLFFSITALANLGHGKAARRGLALIYAAPLLIALAFLILFFIAVGMPPLIAQGPTPTGTGVLFGILTGLFIIGVGVLWFVLPKLLRDARIPEEPEAFPAERPHFVRLFDDTTLFHDPRVASPSLGDRFFPSARRELLKLWWEGDGDLYVRSRRTWLECSFSGAGAPNQTVPLPAAPMTPVELGKFLERTVRDGGGATGKLKAAVVYVQDLNYELPSGASFSDEGDPAEDADPADVTAAHHDLQAEKYQKLGKTGANTDYLLHHAPKALQAIRFGRGGPVPFDPRESGAVSGLGHVRSDGIQVTGDGTTFRGFFTPGDRIRAAGQVRDVTLVRSDTELVVASPFNPALDGAPYERVGTGREDAEGYTFVTNPASGALGGEAVMDYAADLAALLCLGVTPHLLDSYELSVDSLAGKLNPAGTAVDQNLGKVYQVFRNWSLDRRRENEWRMLVSGGATTEKRAPDAYDAAMSLPRDPAWAGHAPGGEPVARNLGFVRLLRQWVAMSSDLHKSDADRATHLELSRAMAFLFDMPDPVAVH